MKLPNFEYKINLDAKFESAFDFQLYTILYFEFYSSRNFFKQL